MEVRLDRPNKADCPTERVVFHMTQYIAMACLGDAYYPVEDPPTSGIVNWSAVDQPDSKSDEISKGL